MNSFLRTLVPVLAASLAAGWLHAQPLNFDPGNPPDFSPDGQPPTFTPGEPPSLDMVPELPVAFFGNDLFVFPGNQNRTSQWYFSFTFKSVFHFTGDNWFFFEEFDAYLWVDVASGSLSTGFWAYTILPGHASWVFYARGGGFFDLRDSNKDGTNDLPDDQAGAQVMEGYFFMIDPMPGDPAGGQWYYFSQFGPENWMLNMGIASPTDASWHQLR